MRERHFSSRGWSIVPAALALIAILSVLPTANATEKAAWRYRADWSGGFAGWMSFPLSQDVGYDPSLYTETEGANTALLRSVVSHGEPRLWMGFLRPLTFQAGPQSTCDITYSLHAAGPVSDMALIFGAADGHHYSIPLPTTNGEHHVHVSGAQLGLKGPATIDVVILKGLSRHPPVGSKTDWLLKKFAISAENTPRVSLQEPALAASSDGGAVARQVLDAEQPLKIEWQSAGNPTQVSVFTPAGQKVVTREIPAGTHQASISLPSSAPGLWRAEVEQAGARTDFRFLVMGAAAPHPRLLLSNARLEELKGGEYADLRKQIHARAASLAAKIGYNAEAGDNIAAMPAGVGIDGAYPGEITPYFQLVDAYSGAVAYNALDYRLNGNAAALDASRRALLTMTKWKTWVPRRFDSHGMQTYYEVGVATQLVAFGYDLIADELSTQDKAEVERAFWKQVIAPTVQEYFVADRDPIGASNWMANSLGGALTAAVAIAGDTPGWKQKEGPAVGELEFAFERLIAGLFPGDGSEVEPLGYENFAMQGLSWGTSALSAMGIKPQGEQRMLEGFWWPYYVTVVPGLQLDTGDFNGHLTKLPGFAWGAEHSGIPELRAYYEKNGGRPDLSHGAPVGNNGHFLEEMPGPLDLACCTGPAPAFTPPPPSRVFPKRGSAVLRSGWDADATVISLRAGAWFNHEHHDQGSFQVAAFGERLIDEAGYAHYYLDPHYPDYFTQAPGHNTVLLDGNPWSQQATNGRFWPGFTHPGFESQMLSEGFDYLRADLTSAFDGALKSYRREYFFLKPGVLVVRDRLQAAQPHVYTWLLHAPPGAALNDGPVHASIATPRAAVGLEALGSNARWSTATTPAPISVFEDLDKKAIPARRELVLTSAKEPSAEFIVAMKFARATDAPDTKLESWSEGSGVGVRTSGENPASMIFRTGAGPIHAGDLSSDGSALIVAGRDWTAIEARVVKNGSRVLVQSSVPVDVTMEEQNGRPELTVHNSAAGTLQVSAERAPSKVVVDGNAMTVKYQQGAFVLPLSSAGEHHVSIQ